MTNFAIIKVFFCFVMFTVHSVRSRDQGTGNQHGLVSRYITKLYDRWTNQTNQSSADGNVFKMPYNSTAVRAMFFSSIQKINNSSTKLTVDRLDGKKIKVQRDELHLFIIKPNNPPTFTIRIKVKDSTNKVMAFRSIGLNATGWFTILLNGKLQDWFNSGRLRSSFYLEFEKANSNASHGYPTIGKSSRKQPYLIVYMK